MIRLQALLRAAVLVAADRLCGDAFFLAGPPRRRRFAAATDALSASMRSRTSAVLGAESSMATVSPFARRSINSRHHAPWGRVLLPLSVAAEHHRGHDRQVWSEVEVTPTG